MRGKVEEELECLVMEVFIEPIQFADWAAPIVPVVKSSGKSIQVCRNFNLTVNQASKVDRYPIPKFEDLFAILAGEKSFTELDVFQPYQQLLLDKESCKYSDILPHAGNKCYEARMEVSEKAGSRWESNPVYLWLETMVFRTTSEVSLPQAL